MRVLVIGQGAREHAICWKLAQSSYLSHQWVWPGHPGTESVASPLNLTEQPQPDAIIGFCKKNKVDLVVVGPEEPLANGLVDQLAAENILAFGPLANVAQLEASKAFAKEIMEAAGIPTARCRVAESRRACEALAQDMLKSSGGVVLKASGLAAGKGVFVCRSQDDVNAGISHLYGAQMERAAALVLVEELLEGRECSYFSWMGANTSRSFGFAVDFKRLQNGDQGPNTGGMGAYTPVPWLPDNAAEQVEKLVIRPLCQELSRRHLSYTGWLYTGLMWTSAGPKVIEFNVRLGDPEAQALAVADQSDWLYTICHMLGLEGFENDHSAAAAKSAVGVVLAADGYPYLAPEHAAAELPTELFAGREKGASQALFGASLIPGEAGVKTGKGRVLTCVGSGLNLQEARTLAYDLVEKVKARWPSALYRQDIAERVTRESAR